MGDLAMEAWKARGRDLNALYAVLSPAVSNPTDDPVADLESLVAERDRLRAALEGCWSALVAHTPDRIDNPYDSLCRVVYEALDRDFPAENQTRQSEERS